MNPSDTHRMRIAHKRMKPSICLQVSLPPPVLKAPSKPAQSTGNTPSKSATNKPGWGVSQSPYSLRKHDQHGTSTQDKQAQQTGDARPYDRPWVANMAKPSTKANKSTSILDKAPGPSKAASKVAAGVKSNAHGDAASHVDQQGSATGTAAAGKVVDPATKEELQVRLTRSIPCFVVHTCK